MPTAIRPRRVLARLLLASWLAGAAAACGDSVRGTADSSAMMPEATAGVPHVPSSGALDTVRTPAGDWTLALAENKLRNAGFAPRREQTETRRAGIAVPGTRYDLGGAQVEIFLYADAIARGRETDALNAAGIAPGAAPAPVIVGDGNLAALVFASDPAVSARVQAALRTESDDGPLEPAGVVPPTNSAGRNGSARGTRRP